MNRWHYIPKFAPLFPIMPTDTEIYVVLRLNDTGQHPIESLNFNFTMLINKFFVSDLEASTIGLKSISMSRVGKFIAIAGKNGAGKSRLLNLLESYIPSYNSLALNRSSWESRLKSVLEHLERTPDELSLFEREINEIRKNISDGNHLSTNSNQQLKVLRFVPKSLDLTNPLSQPAADIEFAHNQAIHASINEFNKNALSYIQYVQDLWWNTTHPKFQGETHEREAAENNYDSLCVLAEKIIGTRFSRLSNGAAGIFHKVIANAGLSDGQKVLLQLIAAIHAKRANLNNTVFLLDELENHLHPSVTIEVLEGLSNAAPDAQIWVATHSVPLLAYITSKDPMALWYMEDGKISHAGRYPEKVLESLLGDSERIGQLSSFTGLPAQLAAINYAAESLLPPLTVGGGQGDPQVKQISTVLDARYVNSKPVVLDFGAGRGRLLEGIAALTGESKNIPIDYLALDNSTADRAQCISVIAEYFQDAEERHFLTSNDFFSRRDDSSLDIIVMCNVLHEIPPGEWSTILTNESSLFRRALKDDGYLLLVEDQRIPVGEKAHEYGFIVLDTAQLKTLFSITQKDIQANLFISNDHRSDGRLKAHLIAKTLLTRMTSETRRKAISELQNYCLQQIEHIRQMPPTYTNGQLHGFWTQQFANAHIYLTKAN